MNKNRQNAFGAPFLLALGALVLLGCGDDVKQPQKQPGVDDPVTSIDSGKGDTGADTAADATSE